MRRNQFSQQPRKMASKIASSQDPRKGSRKATGSQSPLLREAQNKENLHPNLLPTTNKPAHHSDPDCMRNTIAKERKGNDRQNYYQAKEQILHTQIGKTDHTPEHEKNFLGDSHFGRIGLPSNFGHSRDFKLIARSPNSHNSCLPYKNRRNIVKVPLKEITINLGNRSLQKCQLYHQQEAPKAVYLIFAESAFQKELCENNDKNFEFICCEDCGKNYSNKISLSSLKGTTINASGLTTSQYFRKLQEKLDFLAKCKENCTIAGQKFNEMATCSFKKINAYYNSILEVIEVSMRNAQNILLTQKEEGLRTLRTKVSQIEDEQHQVEEEIRKIVNLKAKGSKDSQGNLHSIDMDFSKLKLPTFEVFIDWEEQLQKFSADFTKMYAVKQLTIEDFSISKELQELQEPKHQNSRCGQTGEQRLSRADQGFSNLSRKAVVDPNDIDLFCDEDLDDNFTRVNNFSFDQISPNPLASADCIPQLVDEEDIISPAFKAI